MEAEVMVLARPQKAQGSESHAEQSADHRVRTNANSLLFHSRAKPQTA